MRVSRVLMMLAAVGMIGVACEDDSGSGIPAGLEVFTATLNGANERLTPVSTPATGTAIVTIMDNALSWRGDVTDIDNVVAGHIHVGVADSAGGIVYDLGPTPGDYPTTTTITVGAIQGDTVIALANLMRAGRAYVNIHTNDGVDPVNTGPGDFPAGEIRGQLRKQ